MDTGSDDPLVLSQEEVEDPNVIGGPFGVDTFHGKDGNRRECSSESLPSVAISSNDKNRDSLLNDAEQRARPRDTKNTNIVGTPAQTLAQKRAALQLEKAQKAVRAAAVKDRGTSKGQKGDNYRADKSQADQYFLSLKEESVHRERRLQNAEQNAAEESFAKAGEFRARTIRENIEKAIEVVKDDNLSVKMKQAILKMLGCEELSTNL